MPKTSSPDGAGTIAHVDLVTTYVEDGQVKARFVHEGGVLVVTLRPRVMASLVAGLMDCAARLLAK
jgi:hypothetical protein